MLKAEEISTLREGGGCWERTLIFKRANAYPSIRERVEILREQPGKISVKFTPLTLVLEQHAAVYPTKCKEYGFVLAEGKIDYFSNGTQLEEVIVDEAAVEGENSKEISFSELKYAPLELNCPSFDSPSESKSSVASSSVPRSISPAHLESLAKKLTKWCINHALGYKKRVLHDVIIPKEEFHAQYSQLKAKYSHWVRDWSEKTDPVKFVFEDILISAFLLCLWAGTVPSESKRKFHFVDLGCGNGFLTHILTQEGFSGMGIDLRRRKIWSKFCADGACLEERMIDAKNELFDAEWIIGNHADELVPHIPMIAARSRAKFFVLPCCFFDLEGKKFTLSCKGGRYANFLIYLERIIKESGWKIERETLRIPSTKNIAFIGRYPIGSAESQ